MAGLLCFTGWLLGATSARAQQTNSPAKPADSSTAADPAEFTNWIEIMGGGNIVSGDKAQFQHQTGLPANGFGGVSAFHYETPLDKKGLFSVDGRGIYDNHDYDLKLDASYPDLGYVRAGVRQYREYYDGTGGFLPSNGEYFKLQNNELALDRGTAFFETGLTLPDWPSLKIRYEHDFRSGAKDSTEWESSTLTGPNGTVNAANTKKIAPAFRLIDEKTDTFSADAAFTVKNTDLGLGLRYQWIRNNDSQNMSVYPGQGAASRTLSQPDAVKSDIFNVHAFTDTRINDQWQVTSGYAYTHLHLADLGDRLDSPIPASAAAAIAADTQYINHSAAAAMEQYEMNFSVMYSPCEDLYIVPAARVEKEALQGTEQYTALTDVAGVPTAGALNVGSDNESQVNIAQSLDARYVGITNWVFYVQGDWEQNRDALGQYSGAAALSRANLLILDGDWHQDTQKYMAGANWYPLRGLNFAAQYYHKIDDNAYENNTPPGGTSDPAPLQQYPGFLQQENFITDDANFRVTWRVSPQLTLVSRYDFQYSTVDIRGGQFTTGAGMQQIPAANTTIHMFGESLSWTPVGRFYAQLGANYVLDSLRTGADTQPATSGIVLKSQNDYWTFNSTLGYAIDNKTDVRATYTYYRAADYSDNSTLGLPLGAGSEEHNVSVTLGRQLRRNLHCTLRYAFASYRDQLFGGNLNYNSHTIMTALQYRF